MKYTVSHYHTSDNTPSVLLKTDNYSDAVEVMWATSDQWETEFLLKVGYIKTELNRHEYNNFNGWGMAVYIDKAE